jgi:glycosyltransferase involved in cell wall biosynthesis
LDSVIIIYVDPSLLIQPTVSLENLKTVHFLEYLTKIDVILAANTLGDDYTNGIITHVRYLQERIGIKAPTMILDLCNLPDNTLPQMKVWMQTTFGFIAPSLFVQTHSVTHIVGKPTAVVYPAVSSYIVSKEHFQNACMSNLQVWPRRISGKYRIGCIGRSTFERSPGLCIRIIAELVQKIGPEFVESDIEFLMIGTGELMSDVQELAKSLGVYNYITFSGLVPDLSYTLKTLDIALNVIARGENFGILNAECVLSCCPVIAFNRSLEAQ